MGGVLAEVPCSQANRGLVRSLVRKLEHDPPRDLEEYGLLTAGAGATREVFRAGRLQSRQIWSDVVDLLSPNCLDCRERNRGNQGRFHIFVVLSIENSGSCEITSNPM